MSMLHWVEKANNSNLIIFVHGLKGGLETWSFDENTSFPGLLKADSNLNSLFDIASFDYFTTFTNTYGKVKGLKRLLFSSLKKNSKNLAINELAELLKSEINVHLMDYENIIIIAHSMGGLVSKSCILKQIEENQISNIRGMISLAVPHSGAKIADKGSIISSNVQLKDLGVLSETVDDLNRKWIQTPNTPCTKYIYASHDDYVDKNSALAIDALKKDSMAVNEDHSSICKPKDQEQTVFKAVIKYINSMRSQFKSEIELKTLTDSDIYSTQYFVIKMVLADIHEKIQGHAKEYYYNAESIRKVFTSESDRKQLDKLYQRIKYLYQEELENHISEKTISDQFISSVHQRISAEDEHSLNKILSGLDPVHKKGMLHQLSNQRDTVVVWEKDTTVFDIKKAKENINNEL